MIRVRHSSSPPRDSLMLAGTGRQYMLEAPWMAQWPPLVLGVVMLIFIMAGDALLERLYFRSKTVWVKTIE